MTTRQIDRAKFFASVGYKPHAGQRPVHESVAARRVLACGVRFGKSLCAAMEASAAAMEPTKHGVGWIVAPTYELANKVFREIMRLFQEKLPHRIMVAREHDMSMRVINVAGGVCEIRGKTADNPTNLLGEGLDWLIVDEAAQLRPLIWQSYLSQRLIDKQGWAMLISTPRGKGWFYDMWRRGQPGHHKRSEYDSWNQPTWANPLLVREVVERERDRLPEVVFRQEFGGEFIDGTGQVFHGVRAVATGAFADPFKDVAGNRTPHESYVAGLDLARTQDYTVLVVMDSERRVVYLDRFTRLDWSIQGARLQGALWRYGEPPCLVDSTGAGEPVYEQLLGLGINAKPYTFTNASKKALVDGLALAIEKKMVTLPTPELAPELIDELESFQYSITDAGNVRSGAPTGYHDDCVIALALATHESVNRHVYVEHEIREWA